MAIVRLRRAMDVMLRNISLMYDIIPGTKPIEQLLTEINKANIMPNIIQKHCKVIKEFGNLAAHGGDESSSDLELNTLSIQEANMCAESISAITHWYLTSIAPSIKEESSLTTVSGIQVTKEMINQAVEIDNLNYPPELRGVRETCYSWHDKNPDIYTMILDSNTKKIIGYINGMPLDKEYYNKIIEGDMMDVTILPDFIKTYDLPDFYYLYFASIGIHPSYQNSNAFKVLYDAFVEKLLQLALPRNIYS